MASISRALARVKDDLPLLIQDHAHAALSQEPGFVWRDRKLNPLTTLLLFITQVMHGNTAMAHLRHLWPVKFSATAYCKARRRLPLMFLQRITRSITREVKELHEPIIPRWRGHRVWRGDGSSFSMPDTPRLQDRFGQPGQQDEGCGFPVATLMVLCDAAGFIVKSMALPLRTHDASQISRFYGDLEAGDVLVYDRAACSYVQFALLGKHALHAIIRMHQRTIVSFRSGRSHARQCPKNQRSGLPTSQWLKRLGKHDQLVQWFRPKRKPSWMSPNQYQALPQSMVLRELRYRVYRKGYRSKSVTLVTTLLDPEDYPAEELAGQYLDRWQIEVNLRDLKQTMKMDVLKCKSVDGVLKELAVFVLVHNLVRLVMLKAAAGQRVPVDRISFVDALRWLRDARGRDTSPTLMVNPKRAGRIEPRAIKRRSRGYPLMNRPRSELRQALMNKRAAA